jgi:hypothetical protein
VVGSQTGGYQQLSGEKRDTSFIEMEEIARQHKSEHCQKEQVIQQSDPFDRAVALMQSISVADANIMKQTREYQDFLKAAEQLGTALRQISQWNTSTDGVVEGCAAGTTKHYLCVSFLQHTATDDVITRIFDFLECRDLIHTKMTCSRFQELAERNAEERTRVLASGRQLATSMQLLRAQEQIEGIGGIGITDKHVPIPSLLLRFSNEVCL